jgi:hypothetical protein
MLMVCSPRWGVWGGRTGSSIGCSINVGPDGCLIVIVGDAVLARKLLSFEIIKRHEIGHCNGWGDDHAGARIWYPPQPTK